MKKEVLRIRNLNMPYQERRRYHWVSLILFEGECTAFRGLSFSGKDALVRFLTLRRPCSVEELGLSIDGERVRTQKALEESVYRMAPRGNALREWSCAEYIALSSAGWLLMGRQKRELLQRAQKMVRMLGITLDVRKTLQELSEKEMRLAELARACMRGVRVLVIEDELEGLTEEEIEELSGILQMVAKKQHLTVIINVHSGAVSQALAEHYVIFRDGRIVKKCRKADIVSARMLEDYMLGPMTDSRRNFETRYPSSPEGSDPDSGGTKTPILYRMRSFPAEDHSLKVLKGSSLVQRSGKLLDFSFRASSVVTFLARNEKLRESLFLGLSGRALPGQAYCVIDDKRLEFGQYAQFVKNRVVSIMHLGSREELFGNMSVGENLVLPSIRKISFSDYLTSSRRLTNALDANAAIQEELTDPMKESDVNSRIAVTLDRWYLYNPRVMILLEPFERCDLYGVSIVRSYIRKLAARGACVILIISREEYTQDVSDELLLFD